MHWRTNPIWESDLTHPALAYLTDHRANGSIIFPAAGYIEAMLAIAATLGNSASILVNNVRIKLPLKLGQGCWPRLRMHYATSSHQVGIYSESQNETAPTLFHASGGLAHESECLGARVALGDLRRRCPCAVDSAELYADMRRRGLHYGPSFRGLRQVWTAPGRALAEIGAPPDRIHLFHPVVLDAALQSLLATPELAARRDDLYLPVRIRQVSFHARPASNVWSYSTVSTIRRSLVEADLVMCDGDGNVLLELDGLQCLRYRRSLAKNHGRASRDAAENQACA